MQIIYILTHNCNFDCRYCDVKKENISMSLETIKKSIDFLYNENLEIEKVKFFWWEPLLEKEKIRYIIDNFPKKYNPDFYLTTNASLIDDDFIKYSKINKINLTFSIDWDEFTMEENRITKDKKLIIKIIENAKKYSKEIRINQVITSQNSKNFFKNFKFIYDLWVSGFNFLPAYYEVWTKEGLKNLKKWFDEILDFYSSWNKFELVNLENFSQVSFFNLGIVIDIDWYFYASNFILSEKFKNYKKKFIVWNLKEWFFYNLDEKFTIGYKSKMEEIIKKVYTKDVLLSVKYIDLILNNFCAEVWRGY